MTAPAQLWRRTLAAVRGTPAGAPAAPSPPRRPARTVVTWAVGLYLAALLGCWALLTFAADRWWPVSLLLFGPRWVLAVPLAVLIPAAAGFRRGLLAPLLGAGLVVLGPVLGFCVALPQPAERHAPAARLRVLTCNADGAHVDAAALHELLLVTYPDVVAIQEWAPENKEPVFGTDGWQVCAGHGLCFASRHPVRDTETLHDTAGWRDLAMRHDVETPAGVLHFFNVHLPTPRDGLQAVLHERWHGVEVLRENTAERREESARASAWATQAPGMVLIAGDFNTPSESQIFRTSWGRFADAFSSAGFGLGHTKFTRWWGVRIDHVLSGPGWRCRRCWVGPDVGSDHRPVIADLEYWQKTPK